jgi:hypothetical protein
MSGIHLAFLGSSFQAGGATETTVEYLVIAGGGGTAGNRNGGGGAGGYRTNYTSSAPTPSPKASGGGGSVESAFTATFGTAYTVTVGAGGASGDHDPSGRFAARWFNDSVFCNHYIYWRWSAVMVATVLGGRCR